MIEKIIYSKPRTGRTVELVRRSALTGAVIVCRDEKWVEDTCNTAKWLGLKIPKPITFKDLLNGNFEKNDNGICIDDANLLLEEIANGARIRAAVITDTSSELN